MLNFFKRKPATPETEPKRSWLGKLKDSLTRTRTQFTQGLANVFLGKKTLEPALLNEIETQLLAADVGVVTTQQIINTLTQAIARRELGDPPAVKAALIQQLQHILDVCEQPLVTNQIKPFVILMVGVNGAGKTTTIGKLTQHFQAQQQQVLLAAGDTFRAAAIDQLQVWAQRNQTQLIAQQPGADSGSVIYDAIQAAQARATDIVLADTAGRLHTKDNLMTELQKIKRVIKKLDPTAPHEILLVLDASTGQNALQQAIKFHEALHITGIVLTKLDGTAKGGIIFAIANQLKLPIRFIGTGEQLDDLRPFDAQGFIQALFD